MTPVLGFIGFGEVASVFSMALSQHGARVLATDVLLSRDGGEAVLRERMAGTPIELVSMSDLIHKCDVVLSTVTTMVACQVAEEAAPFLRQGQVYLDLNSTSPGVKKKIASIIDETPADFVEAAVLGAVGASGAQARMLLCGERGVEIAELLSSLGLRPTFYATEIGKASMFKMLRSIFSKGLECLVIEFLIAIRRAGIEDDLWNDIAGFMATKPFDVIADNWTRTHGTAYERRYHEMEQVVETMAELGVSPIMTEATTALFARSSSLDLASHLDGAEDLRNAVIDALEQADRPGQV